MRRRDFLIRSVALVGAFAAPYAFANNRNRAAVIIGVNKAGNLPKLNAAASGAVEVADWLKSEGYEVKLFVDEKGPVKASDLFDAIAELVARGTLDQLVVYFSGHGFLNAFSEYWMLSNAPQNPNEAVSLVESVLLAKESAIPNVVFISDACRSTPDSIGASRVRGSVIFPNSDISRNVRADVDQFLAALPGNPAAEVPISQSVPIFEGIFTSCLLSAFKAPVAALITKVDGIDVITNRKLKIYLESEVVKRAEAKSVRLQQKPDATIVSGDTTYLASIASVGELADFSPPSWTIKDFAAAELQSAGAGNIIAYKSYPKILPSVPLTGSARREFTRTQENVRAASVAAREPLASAFPPDRNNAEFLVSGARVIQAKADNDANFDLRNVGPNDAGSKVRVIFHNETSTGVPLAATSVALRFSDGSGTVIAALRGFICSLVVDESGVVSANYVRMEGGADPRIDDLHAAVTAAAQNGVFRIEGDREEATRAAREFGDRIRVGKSTDPTLGLYAAYAYAQADLLDQVQSVSGFMRDDLGTELFDVAMLARELSGSRNHDSKNVFPFCPMLSQGWNLLRVLQVTVPPAVDQARDHLRPALWTTFDHEGMDIVFGALDSGKVR